MMRNPTQFRIQTVGAAALLALTVGLGGCRVHVDKGANGEDKTVQVDTPFGGVHVNTNQTTAADLGLPPYPGAHIVPDKSNDKSADVHMGFGDWELRVKVVNYSTPDSQAQVEAFYQKALTHYGDVISCQNDSPVGKATSTSEGLTCADDGKSHVKIANGEHSYGYHSDKNGLELKAGSKRHQHIVAFESAPTGQTRFSLVAIELPAAVTGGSASD